MSGWHKKMLKHTDTTAKFVTLLLSIVLKVRIALKDIYSWSKKREEVTQPKDYEAMR